jgi:predicted DNA-binding protein (UPF0251 family)
VNQRRPQDSKDVDPSRDPSAQAPDEDRDLAVELQWPEGMGGFPAAGHPTGRAAAHGSPENATGELDGRLRADLDTYIRMTLDACRATLQRSESEALARLRDEVDRHATDLGERVDISRSELHHASSLARNEVKSVFAEQAEALERLVGECHRDLEQIVETYIVELENSLTNGRAELNRLAESRFAEFDSAVGARTEEFQRVVNRSAATVAEVADTKVDGLRRQVRAWANEQESSVSQRLDAVLARSRTLGRMAALAISFALVAVGVAVAALLVAR